MRLFFNRVPSVETLADDELGTIVLSHAFFNADQAADWFDRLRTGVAWRTERRPMYDRIVEVPRLVASFRLDDAALPGPIRDMLPPVADFSRATFTSAGLNFYRDGNDSVAPHGDHVENMPVGAPIALVSLGAPRRMTIRSRERPRRTLDRDLEAGDLLVMSYESQFHYDHGIPKTKDAVGERISVAFRVT